MSNDVNALEGVVLRRSKRNVYVSQTDHYHELVEDEVSGKMILAEDCLPCEPFLRAYHGAKGHPAQVEMTYDEQEAQSLVGVAQSAMARDLVAGMGQLLRDPAVMEGYMQRIPGLRGAQPGRD